MSDKEHIHKMTETNATIGGPVQASGGHNSEQHTLIKELTASLVKTSRLKVPFTRDNYKYSKEDRDAARKSGDRKKPCTHCGEVAHLPKSCYSLGKNADFRPAWYKKKK